MRKLKDVSSCEREPVADVGADTEDLADTDAPGGTDGRGGGAGVGTGEPGARRHWQVPMAMASTSVIQKHLTRSYPGREPVPVDVSNPRVDVSNLRAPMFPALAQDSTFVWLLCCGVKTERAQGVGDGCS